MLRCVPVGARAVVHFQFVHIKLKRETNDATLSEYQKYWRRTVEVLVGMQPPVVYFPPSDKGPVGAIRRLVFAVTQHPVFDTLMLTAIGLNTLTMTMTHYQQSDAWSAFLDWCNTLFVAIFTAESALKIVALGWPTFWKDTCVSRLPTHARRARALSTTFSEYSFL